MANGQNGGKREGAGRPTKLSTTLKNEAVVRKRLRGGAEAGWEVLAEQYPSLMRRAIALALGCDLKGEEVAPPNVSMLKTLIELMPKVVGTDTGADDSPIAQLIKRMHAKLSATIEVGQPVVGGDIGGCHISVAGGDGDRPAAG